LRIFATGKGGLEEIPSINFKNEREIQRTVEENIAAFFPGLEKVQSECTIKNKRIDTLAFDNRAKAFVIIEYKTANSRDIYDQVLIYHNKIMENKDSCVLLLSKMRNRVMDSKEIDWQQTRLILIRPSFTPNQIEASNSKDSLDIKLYEIHKYPDHLTLSRVGVADDKLDPFPDGDPSNPSDPTHNTFDTSIILSVFKDGQTHTLREVYLAVEELYAQKQIPTFRIRQRVRARLRALCVKGTMVHVNQATYRLASSSSSTDTESSTHRLPRPRSERNDKPSVGRASFDTSIILSVFKDGKIHTLDEVYAAVRESCALQKLDLAIKRRVRGRIRALCVGGNMAHVGTSTYRLASGSDHTNNHQSARDSSTTVYSEADWLDGKYRGSKPTPQVRDLYFALNKVLLVARHLERVQNKKWASYRLQDGTQVCSIILHKSKLEIVYAISKGDVSLPNDFVHDISGVGHWGTGDYRSYIVTRSDASRAMECVVRVQQHLSISGV